MRPKVHWGPVQVIGLRNAKQASGHSSVRSTVDAAVAPIDAAACWSSSAVIPLSTVRVISASPCHLHGRDVDTGLAEERSDRADDAGAVGVPEEQQHAIGVQLQVEVVQ